MKNKKKKRGFTLVELIAVIALLGIIGLIAIPVVEGIVKRSKDRVYNTQLEEIKSAAKKAITENQDIVLNGGNTAIICLSTLKEYGYLENTKITDPRTDTPMRGGVMVEYIESTNSYTYEYDEEILECK